MLLDAAAAPEQMRDPLLADSLLRQLRAADLVLLNKMDLLGPPRQDAAREWLTGVIGRAPVIETVKARVPLAVLGSIAPADPEFAAVGDDDAGHDGHPGHDYHSHIGFSGHAERFEAWSQQPAGVFSASGLRVLLRDMPGGVLRLKGLLRTDEHGWAELQFAGRHGSLRRAVAAPGGDAATLVAIGLRGRLPARQLAASLRAATVDH